MCCLPGKWEFSSVAARGCAGIEPAKGAAPDQRRAEGWMPWELGKMRGFQLV